VARLTEGKKNSVKLQNEHKEDKGAEIIVNSDSKHNKLQPPA
jgi:hypothetical protein